MLIFTPHFTNFTAHFTATFSTTFTSDFTAYFTTHFITHFTTNFTTQFCIRDGDNGVDGSDETNKQEGVEHRGDRRRQRHDDLRFH